ncbi:MAG: glycosyltransferase family 39 protein [Chthoniobacteraceae bacterium]
MRLQEFIHSLEQGGLARWIWYFVVLLAMAFFYVFFVVLNFRGLSEANGMDQAQVAREIARGNGFSTKDIRPLEIAMLKQNKPGFALDITPEIYHAPLNPYINSFFLRLTKKTWTMTTRDVVYPSDRMIATVSMVFMVLGFIVSFLTARRIFDEKISALAIVLTLFCSQYWTFMLSGLPQMLMFFIFSCCCYVIFSAIEARLAGKPTTWLLAIAGFLFGLLALAHNLTIWIFVGMLIFSLIYFTPRYKGTLIMLAVFLLVFSPWLVRNYRVCGNPFGLSHLSFIGSLTNELNRMRGQDVSLSGLSLGDARARMTSGYNDQISKLMTLLGQNCVAPVFFLTLLYIFKRREASDFRWCLFLMWIFAFLGISIVGLNNSNNLFILFIPLITLYGFAYVMMLWSRLDINIPLFRYTFIFIIYVISGVPLYSLYSFEKAPSFRVNWPPYVPPFIALLNTWTTENEIIASDIPWGVAWYADRKSLLIPVSISDFLNLYDYRELNGNLVGLYLTPVTGNKALVSDILKGDDKDWAPFVLRGVRSKDFPFQYSTPLPIDKECVFYCESDRWSPKAD